MAETDIDSSAVGNLEGTETLFSVPSETLDSAQDQDETEYINVHADEQMGYYKKISELKSAIDAKARWVIGKGLKSNELTELTLSTIKGHGKDTFNTILANQIRIAEIQEDSYAEIIRDNDNILINLKPLNTATMKIVANRQGMIIRYEQINRVNNKTLQTFTPEQIFHLSRGRIGDEIHGISVVDVVKEIIDTRNEAIRDYRTLLRRNVNPVKLWEIDTDNPAKVATFQAKVDKAFLNSENLVVPQGSVLPPNIISVAPNATLNPLPWINTLTQNFYQEVGVPQIIAGGAQEITEASAKIAYLAWEQTVEEYQLYVEEQVLSQLNLEINLEFPASLQNELLSDGRKDVESGATSPEDTSVQGVGLGGTA